jgi:hypothetical protein
MSTPLRSDNDAPGDRPARHAGGAAPPFDARSGSSNRHSERAPSQKPKGAKAAKVSSDPFDPRQATLPWGGPPRALYRIQSCLAGGGLIRLMRLHQRGPARSTCAAGWATR